MTDHYTLRLTPGMKERLSERARRFDLPERTLAQRYLEEGLRHDAHPLVQFLDRAQRAPCEPGRLRTGRVGGDSDGA